MKIEEQIKQIIRNIRTAKGLNDEVAINDNTTLRGDLGLTSFDLAELTVKIEDEFDIDIFEDGLVNTIGEIYAKLSK